MDVKEYKEQNIKGINVINKKLKTSFDALDELKVRLADLQARFKTAKNEFNEEQEILAKAKEKEAKFEVKNDVVESPIEAKPETETTSEIVENQPSTKENESAKEEINVATATEDDKSEEITSTINITVDEFVGTSKHVKKFNEEVDNKKQEDNFSDSYKKGKDKAKDINKKKANEGEIKGLSKREKIKKGYESATGSYVYDEEGEVAKIRVRKSNDKDKHKPKQPVVQTVIDHAVITTENITVKGLSEKIGKSVPEILKKLMLGLGIMKTINDTLDFDTASLIANEFNVTLEQKIEQTSEEKLLSFHNDEENDDPAVLETRPPIVTIMGHVDHGKTSILDYIRKAHVASGEAGGITQHIGAYTIKVPYEGEMKQITFLDTPGHEAFTAMRARGANITDIVVLVVAADDGIMPQTIEAINHSRAAGVSIIVAINKMDKPGVNPDKVISQLAENGLISDEWSGGDIPTVRVSAKTGMNIEKLLENILLTAEISDYKANPNRAAKGTIIEAKLDKGKGPVATVLVQNGTLSVGDFMVAGTAIGRVRAMFDDKGKPVHKAGPSTPVSVLGLQDVPNPGDQMMVVKDEKLSRQVAEERKEKEKIEKAKFKKASLEEVFSEIEEGKLKELNLIIKTDVQGTSEAVKQSLLKLSNEEVKVRVVHTAVGTVNESDINLALATNSIIIGFNIRPDNNVKTLAEKNGVQIKLYRVIYDAINDIELAIKGMLAPTYKETFLGRADVRQVYKISGVGTIAGCYVKEGVLEINASARLIRDGVLIVESKISSLRRVKEDVREVKQDFECGVGLNKYNDIHEGDVIEAFKIEEVK